jgi:ribosomal protein S6E (S10)
MAGRARAMIMGRRGLRPEARGERRSERLRVEC